MEQIKTWKKQWEYNYQKGLRGALISVDIIERNQQLYFVLHYGESKWESLLIRLDMQSLEGQTLFREAHVMRSPGILEDDRFYFTTFRGMAYCVDLSGTVIWQTEIGGEAADWNVLLDGNRLFMSAYGMYCLNKEDGFIIWSNPNGCKTNCSFAVDAACIYHGELGGVIRCVDKVSGNTVWTYGENLWISHCILIGENCLMACNIHGSFLFLDSKTGKCKREVSVGRKLYRRPVFYNGKLYIGDGNSVINSTEGFVSCYELQDDLNLKPIFSFQTGGEISTKAVIDGRCLYFASEDGYLYCIDKETGEELRKRKKTKGTCRAILLQEDSVIVLSDKGQVECYI
ncbi:MAG: PQQ-like beta-propeller repeat protein [Bacteroides sp.]|nr:PQQ-like beta-propeller repeat protein [Bacteroides sp.]MCM1548675.1 PQQ-like beta-propeller repeat protein [Clostridium sp.]